MGFSLYSATGCVRCKIVKSYMKENGIAFQEFDFKSDGKDEFNAFYRKNRPSIYRGEEGVEFPLLYDEEKVIQGVGVIIAFLKTERLLDQFVSRSELSHGWVSGLTISEGDAACGDDFVAVVAFLKAQGLKTQIETDGRNVKILSQLIEKSQVDRLIFNLRGPAGLYKMITQSPLDPEELKLSLSLVEHCPEYKIILPLQPFWRTDTQKEFISPEEAAEAASFVEKSTGRKTHPFYIKEYSSSGEKEDLPVPNLFKYRTACRRYMVKTEILKK
ncbi:MAG: hypothetical protein HN416_12590 [Nitrospina sp.]|jgi:glutaredoxin|nr:hypothetical protein [Nitrospina sp.]